MRSKRRSICELRWGRFTAPLAKLCVPKVEVLVNLVAAKAIVAARLCVPNVLVLVKFVEVRD